MLRRVQAIKIDQDDAPEPAPKTAPSEDANASFLRGGAVGALQADLERASATRREPETPTFQVRPSGSPGDRRRADRRGMDALRYEALQNVISQVEDRNFGGLREKVSWTRGLKPSRLAL